MATAMAQRIATGAQSAAIQRRAVAPRAAFSSAPVRTVTQVTKLYIHFYVANDLPDKDSNHTDVADRLLFTPGRFCFPYSTTCSLQARSMHHCTGSIAYSSGFCCIVGHCPSLAPVCHCMLHTIASLFYVAIAQLRGTLGALPAYLCASGRSR